MKYASNEKDILTYYLYAGYTYEAITKFLSNYHDITMSIRTLFGLKKKGRTLSNDVISQLIQGEIQGHHIMRGYRGIWHLLKTSYNISVTRDSAMELLKEIDPVGSEMRRARTLRRRKYISPGPNAVWHADPVINLNHMVFRFMVRSTDFLDVFYGLMLLDQIIFQTCMLTFTLTQLNC